MTRQLTIPISEAEVGVRLDKLVTQHTRDLGRRAAARLFRDGAVRVDGRRAFKGDSARLGSIVVVDLPTDEFADASTADALNIRLERSDLVVVSKPSGQPTAPLRVGEAGTLAGALAVRYPEMKTVGYRQREPGIVHRLDTQTSGLVLAARKPVAFEQLRAALTEGQLEKRYFAIVEGTGLPGSGEIDRALGPHPRDRRRVVVVPDDAAPRRAAVTSWRRIERFGQWALLEVTVSRAYRHQIRVHLADLGHPIAGDALYGGAQHDGLGNRHALHASHLAWTGNDSVEGFEVDDPLPPDLESVLRAGQRA